MPKKVEIKVSSLAQEAKDVMENLNTRAITEITHLKDDTIKVK